MVFGSLGRSANNVMIHIKGDSKSLDSAVNSSDRKLGSFASKAKAYGPMIGAAFAAAAVGFIAMSVKMAAAEADVNTQTASLLKSQGIMWKEVKNEVSDYINELEALTAYGDTDLQINFNEFLSAGMDIDMALKSMSASAAIAASGQMSLTAAAMVLRKEFTVGTSRLKNWGIEAENMDDILTQVNDTFGDGSQNAETFEGKMRTLKNTSDDFREAIGVEMLDPLTEFIGLLLEGGENAESFGTKLGKIIAVPFKEITRAKTVEKLAIELHELEMIQKRTAEEERRRTEIIFEMQQRIAGTWAEYEASRITANKTMTDAEWEKASAIYQGLGYSREYLETLRNQTAETKKQTAEMEKQLTMRQKAARAQGRIMEREGMGGRMEDIKAGRIITAAGFKEKYGVESPYVVAQRSGII